MGYIFDGTAKTITLTAGTVTLDLVDLHSRWKDWVYANNAGCLIAFRAIGGDIPAIPLYLFLLAGWQVVPQAANHTLTVTNGVFEVEGGGDPFIDPVGSYKIRINRQAPGIAIGYSATGSSLTLSEIEASAVLAKEATVAALNDISTADILAAASTAPIAANVKEVNDTTVKGSGTELDPWGPV